MSDYPDWLPDEYDPDAPLRERLRVMANIEGRIELHVRDPRGVTEVIGSPVNFHEREGGTYQLDAGYGDDMWQWEVIAPPDGPARLYKVQPELPMELYEDTRERWLSGIDVRIYGIDTGRFETEDAE